MREMPRIPAEATAALLLLLTLDYFFNHDVQTLIKFSLPAFPPVQGGPMKRTLWAGLLTCGVMLWPARAHQEAAPIANDDTTMSKASIKWETVDGSLVLKVWQLEGPKSWP